MQFIEYLFTSLSDEFTVFQFFNTYFGIDVFGEQIFCKICVWVNSFYFIFEI